MNFSLVLIFKNPSMCLKRCNTCCVPSCVATFWQFNFVNREKIDEISMNNNEEINEYTFKSGCI